MVMVRPGFYTLSKAKTGMELNKVKEHWDAFPEMSMEERPVLSTDLEKLVVKNPLSGGFYLKNKLIVKIVAGIALWLFNIYQLKTLQGDNRDDGYQQVILLIILSYFVYFHVRLLLFADYPTLLTLRLIPFLSKIETVMDKYIFSFRILSAIAGFYLLAAFRKLLLLLHSTAYASIDQNPLYKWLIIIFLSISFNILLLHSVIPKYRKLLETVREYKGQISQKLQKI
jgi:hypothetical protein